MGGKKWQLAPFSQGRGKRSSQYHSDKTNGDLLKLLALLSSSHQMKLVDFGVLSLVGSAFFPEVQGSEKSPAGPPSQQLGSAETVQKNQNAAERILAAASRPGKERKKKVLKLAKTSLVKARM